jgi:ATP-binding protein involved in chromosome partitioning
MNNTPTLEQIKSALTRVIDPELHKNIVDLGMVHDIHIEEGHVKILLALTMQGCPMRNQLQEQTQAAAASVAGVECVTVELTTMTEAQRQQLKDKLSPATKFNRIGRLVAIMSGKGGVGKSSVTAMLASSLKRKGHSVGVLDADITGPSIPRLFGVSGPVSGLPMGILPVESSSGIKIMSTNLMLPEEDQAVIFRGPIMSSTIRQYWNDVLWGRLDYLLVDLPPGTSDATLTAMQSLPLDGVLMVTTPQSLSSMVVRKTVHMAQELKVPIFGIIENMSFFICPETGIPHQIFGPSHTQAISQLADAPILAYLPIDPHMTHLADTGKIEQYEHNAYQELTDVFIQHVPPREPAPAPPWMA